MPLFVGRDWACILVELLLDWACCTLSLHWTHWPRRYWPKSCVKADSKHLVLPGLTQLLAHKAFLLRNICHPLLPKMATPCKVEPGYGLAAAQQLEQMLLLLLLLLLPLQPLPLLLLLLPILPLLSLLLLQLLLRLQLLLLLLLLLLLSRMSFR